MPYHNFSSVHIEGVVGSIEKKKGAKDNEFYVFTIGVEKRSAVQNPDGSLAKTDWFECVCYNSELFSVLLTFKKGSHIGFKGVLSTSNYVPEGEDVSNKYNWRKRWKLVAEDVWAPIPTEEKKDLGRPRPSGSLSPV